jgi:hypothetical protein
LLPLAVACAAKRPVLYPNETLNQVGYEAAQRDVDECLGMAQAYGLEANPAGKTAGSTAAGSAVGAATAGAWGAVRGGAGSHAAAGAAAGATGGFLRGLFRWRNPDPIQARFVGVCLRRQGYEVIGGK